MPYNMKGQLKRSASKVTCCESAVLHVTLWVRDSVLPQWAWPSTGA